MRRTRCENMRTRVASRAGECETSVCGEFRRCPAVAGSLALLAAFASASCSNADSPREGAGTATRSVAVDVAAYWRLDELSGTVAGDSSGGGYTGQLAGAPTWTTGHPGTDGG